LLTSNGLESALGSVWPIVRKCPFAILDRSSGSKRLRAELTIQPIQRGRTNATALRSFWRDLLFLVQVSRPGFWLTAIWFYMLPLARRRVFDSFEFWLGLFFITFPLGLLIYGWNDIMDSSNDRQNQRKGNWLFGPQGTAEQLRKLPWAIATVHLPFIILFYALNGPIMLGWYGAVLGATAIYNWPRVGTKGWPVVDVLNQLGYLLVFSLSSTLNHVPQLPWPALLFGGLFAMHSHLLSEVLDLGPDRLAGRRTTALLIGAVRTKLLVATLLLSETTLAAVIFRDVAISSFLAAGTLWFFLDALWLFRERPYPEKLVRWFFIAWNVVLLASFWHVWSSGSLLCSFRV
jgi:4-hydroxybenzoate polyprenyltransferase